MTSSPRARRTGWTEERILALVREHERLVRSYLRSLGCPADRLEDLAQETFVRIFTRPARDPAELRGTLFVVARNIFFNSLRDDASRPDLEELERAWREFERDDSGSAYLDALRSCLEGLPSRTRDVLRLRFGTDTPRAEIAERVDLSLGGLKSLLARAKEALRECVQRKLGADAVDSLEAAR